MEDGSSVNNYVDVNMDDTVNIIEVLEVDNEDENMMKHNVMGQVGVIEKVLEDEKTTNEGIPPKPKLQYKVSSSVWQHFTKTVKHISKNGKKEDKQEVTCNYCKKVLAYSSKNGTSSMRKHLDGCTYCDRGQGGKRQKLLSLSSPTSNSSSQVGTLTAWQFDQTTSRRSFAEMIILDELPFKLVECEGFRRYITKIQPLVKFVSRTTVAKDVALVYESEKTKLMSFFHDQVHSVCLTTDMWTSIANEGYLCLTAHYIDDKWKLNKKIINFCLCPPPHTGECIANVVFDCLMKWNFNRICSITMDNASSNDVAARKLKELLMGKGLLVGDGSTFCIRCATHILNLIVRDGVDEIQDSISRIRNVIKHVRASPARKDKFEKYCQKAEIKEKGGLCLDVPTRWNSTYFMLESALKFRAAFDKLGEKDAVVGREGPPSVFDWDNAQALCLFLKKFFEITKALSGTSYVTSSMLLIQLYEVGKLLLMSLTSDNYLIQDMSKRMRDKFNKYWGSLDKINIMLLIANALDPRYKLRFISYFYAKLFDKSKSVEATQMVTSELHKLFKFYESHSIPRKASNEVGEYSESNAEACAADDFLSFCEENDEQWSKTEIDMYLQEPGLLPTSKINVLEWWSTNAFRFRVLSLIARDIFAIPVSTVASESAFNTGGRVLDPYRSSLSANTVESLICCQDWLRTTPKPSDIEEVFGEFSIAIPGTNLTCSTSESASVNSNAATVATIPNKGKEILNEG